MKVPIHSSKMIAFKKKKNPDIPASILIKFSSFELTISAVFSFHVAFWQDIIYC